MNRLLSFLAVSGFFLSCAPRKFNGEGQASATVDISSAQRIDAIRRAEVWIAGTEDKVAERDLLRGPSHPLFDAHEKELECIFSEPKEIPGGRTPKFNCQFLDDSEKKSYKIKYDPFYNIIHEKPGARNLEVYGEILSTRLMWALGFPADNIFTPKVNCLGCPPDPWLYIRRRLRILDAADHSLGFVREELLDTPEWIQRSDRRFHPVVAEVKFKGDAIATDGKEGWSWPELFQYMENPEVQRPQREALTILMAFINHMDNQPEQQRLVCEKSSWDGERCGKPVMMVQDAGSTFGNGWAPFQGNMRLNKVDVKEWEQLSVWEETASCIVKVHGAPNATFRTKWQVSEKGRAFLANLMAKLSEKQIRDLFTAARIERVSGEGTLEVWVAAFMNKLKRDILQVRCGR
jgi:hypothetical protein